MAIANILLGMGQPAKTWAPNYTGPTIVSKTVAVSSNTEIVQLRFEPDGTLILPAGGSGNVATPWRWYDQGAATPWANAQGFELEVIARTNTGPTGASGPPLGFYSLHGEGAGVSLSRSNLQNEGITGTWGTAFGLRIWDIGRTQYYSLPIIDLQLNIV